MTVAKKNAPGGQASSGAEAETEVEARVEADAGEVVADADELPDDEVSAVGGGATESAPADSRERFRQALERKNSQPGSHPGSQSAPGAHLKGSNSKRKREFRRKSG